LAKLTEEIDSDRKQLEAIEKRLTSNEKLKHALQARLGTTAAAKSSSYGSTWENIRKAVKQIEKPRFTYDDIEAALKQMIPGFQLDKNRLRTAIWTLQDKEDTIKQVEKGDNRNPAVYALIGGSDCPPRPIRTTMVSNHKINGPQ